MSSARNSRRRRRNRRRFSALFKLLAIAAVLAALTLGATVFFQLEEVVVTGTSRYTPEEVKAASGLEAGDNLFRLNKLKISDNILQTLPYVEELTIRRKLPDTILITVKEWDAVASVQPTAYTPSGEAEGEDAEGMGPAGQAWLISVGGKLLETAPVNSSAIKVTGLTALGPRAGKRLAVPQEQDEKLSSLLALLAALEERGMLEKVSQLDLTAAAQIRMRYEERFWVRLPMGGEFDYKLRVLDTVAAQREDYESGSFDLTREDYAVMYSPDA